MQMKSVLLLTDVAFWSRSAGHCTRIFELVRTVALHTRLTIVFIGLPGPVDEVILSASLRCELIFLEKDRPRTAAQYGRQMKRLLRLRQFDFCIVEYCHLSYYLDCLPGKPRTILDIHDIMSERSDSFRRFHYDHDIPLTREMERAIFQLYDYVIVICDADFNSLKENVPDYGLLLCPHPAETRYKKNRAVASAIGFVGSGYLPNLDAIETFLDHCWPAIAAKYDVSLHIYGNVGYRLAGCPLPASVRRMGFVEDPAKIYEECDVMINPVRFGAGLKIKNIEALAYGLPLITSTHGARGLEKGAGEAFLVADGPAEWIAGTSELMEDYSLRERLSVNANLFIARHFSVTQCFDPLTNLLDTGN